MTRRRGGRGTWGCRDNWYRPPYTRRQLWTKHRWAVNELPAAGAVLLSFEVSAA